MLDLVGESNLNQLPEVLNPKIVAAYLNIGYAKALELIKSGSIPCLKVGNHYKIPKKGFVQWLEEPGYREFL